MVKNMNALLSFAPRTTKRNRTQRKRPTPEKTPAKHKRAKQTSPFGYPYRDPKHLLSPTLPTDIRTCNIPTTQALVPCFQDIRTCNIPTTQALVPCFQAGRGGLRGDVHQTRKGEEDIKVHGGSASIFRCGTHTSVSAVRSLKQRLQRVGFCAHICSRACTQPQSARAERSARHFLGR